MSKNQAIDIGEAGRNVAANVRRLRDRRRWTYKELSDRLGEAGRPINAESVRRIEEARRRVDVADLVALAEVLATPVNRLVAPATEEMLLDEMVAEMSPEWVATLSDRLDALRQRKQTDSRVPEEWRTDNGND